jgi:hypothetical protein
MLKKMLPWVCYFIDYAQRILKVNAPYLERDVAERQRETKQG